MNEFNKRNVPLYENEKPHAVARRRMVVITWHGRIRRAFIYVKVKPFPHRPKSILQIKKVRVTTGESGNLHTMRRAAMVCASPVNLAVPSRWSGIQCG